jgi:hypothetical protein
VWITSSPASSASNNHQNSWGQIVKELFMGALGIVQTLSAILVFILGLGILAVIGTAARYRSTNSTLICSRNRSDRLPA